MREFSVSAARRYRACPRAHWLRCVAHVAATDQAPANLRGIVMHAGLAAAYHALAAGRDPIAALEACIAQRAEHHGLDDDAADDAAETAAYAFERLGPRPGDIVLAVERELRTTVVSGGHEVPLLARVDVAYRRGDRVTVRDWKSSSTPPRARDLDRDDQLALGALCAARTFGATRLDVEIASIGSGVAVSAPISRSAAQSAAARIAATAVTAEHDTEFAPRRNPDCASCGVRRACPLFATDSTIPVPGPDGAPVMVEPPVRRSA